MNLKSSTQNFYGTVHVLLCSHSTHLSSENTTTTTKSEHFCRSLEFPAEKRELVMCAILIFEIKSLKRSGIWAKNCSLMLTLLLQTFLIGFVKISHVTLVVATGSGPLNPPPGQATYAPALLHSIVTVPKRGCLYWRHYSWLQLIVKLLLTRDGDLCYHELHNYRYLDILVMTVIEMYRNRDFFSLFHKRFWNGFI